MLPQNQIAESRAGPPSITLDDEGPIPQAIAQVAGRISSVLAEEGQLLQCGGVADFDSIIARKSHLLLELGRLVGHLDGQTLGVAACARLKALSLELADNASLLRRHLDAVREISSIIAAAMSTASTDGTYSADAARRGRASW